MSKVELAALLFSSVKHLTVFQNSVFAYGFQHYKYIYSCVLGVTQYIQYSYWTITVRTSQFTPIQEGGARSNTKLFENRQQKNSECRELRAWKQSTLNSDHVLILNVSLTWTDKVLRTQLFAKWGFVLVYPTSLIRHKYFIIFPYLRCNWMLNYYLLCKW